MSDVSRAKPLSEREIETLANSRAEREALVKSTVVFAGIWAASFLVLPFIQRRSIRFLDYVVSLSTLYVVAAFLVAFVAGLVTRWIVKDSAYEKYYTLYKEQQTQEQTRIF